MIQVCMSYIIILLLSWLQVELESAPAMIEEVGGVGCGLEAMELSPDMEILVLVTREMAVITMTRQAELERGRNLQLKNMTLIHMTCLGPFTSLLLEFTKIAVRWIPQFLNLCMLSAQQCLKYPNS